MKTFEMGQTAYLTRGNDPLKIATVIGVQYAVDEDPRRSYLIEFHDTGMTEWVTPLDILSVDEVNEIQAREKALAEERAAQQALAQDETELDAAASENEDVAANG